MYVPGNTCEEFHGGDPYKEPPRPPGTNVVIVVGATATSKTELSLDLADMIREAHGTENEIVAVDKRTTHSATEAITAAPTPEEQNRAPHHMVGVLDPFDHWIPRWTYQAMARACIRDVVSRDRLPILVGGSIHLMEALAYYPGYHHLGADRTERKRLKSLSLDDLRVESLARGFGGPFEDNPRRWRNHIMARAALQRPRKQPPYPGTLLFGVYRDQEMLKERIAMRLENTYWHMVHEVERSFLFGPLLTPPPLTQTIGVGNFAVPPDTPEETSEEVYRRTKQSIFDQTTAFAEWQQIEIGTWMERHVNWGRVGSRGRQSL